MEETGLSRRTTEERAQVALPAWAHERKGPELTAAAVHVWTIDMARFVPGLDDLLQALDEQERQKARGFRFEQHRVRYVVAHGALRVLLGRYLDTDPSAIQFQHNVHGKPALAPQFADHSIHFNMSHSDNVALVAVGLGREIGVDVERIRPEMTGEEIARRFFAPGEAAALGQVDPGKRHEAFFACWTRKEAYIKGRGQGLSIPLDSFEVSLVPGEPAKLLRVTGEPEAAKRWHLHSLEVGEGYCAALAAEGPVGDVVCRRWDGR